MKFYKGFTLIELMIYVAVVGIILAIAAGGVCGKSTSSEALETEPHAYIKTN